MILPAAMNEEPQIKPTKRISTQTVLGLWLAALTLASLSLPHMSLAEVSTAIARAKSGAFDTVGEAHCAQEVKDEIAPCKALITYADTATVIVVNFPSGFARTLIFSKNEFIRGNATMSGVGTDKSWHISDGKYHIRVDDQRFVIPETLVHAN